MHAGTLRVRGLMVDLSLASDSTMARAALFWCCLVFLPLEDAFGEDLTLVVLAMINNKGRTNWGRNNEGMRGQQQWEKETAGKNRTTDVKKKVQGFD